jgi:hypothetical protein
MINIKSIYYTYVNDGRKFGSYRKNQPRRKIMSKEEETMRCLMEAQEAAMTPQAAQRDCGCTPKQ